MGNGALCKIPSLCIPSSSLYQAEEEDFLDGVIDRGKLVAAIDLGTATSGIAYSLRKVYLQERLRIDGANFNDVKNLGTTKVPTAVLFDPNRMFNSFGQEAQDKFSALCRDHQKEAKEWLYFHRFKLLLFDRNDLSLKTELQDYWRRHTLPAMQVFSAALDQLRWRLMQRLATLDVGPDEVDWVITIPSIWNDKAKQFMREAAVRAGIPNQKLMLVLEPEAATVYTRVHSEEEVMQGRELEFDITPSHKGASFMMVDCGGGTVDVTTYQVQDMDSGMLKELWPPSGGDWGGTRVDEAFEDFMYQVLGFDNLAAVNQAELMDVEKAFEEAKKNYRGGERVLVKIPRSAMVFFLHGDYSRYPGVKMVEDQLSLDEETFISFFTPSIISIVTHVQSLLAEEKLRDVSMLIMVGGFSQCHLLQDAMKKAVGERVKVIFPGSMTPSILLGAVLFLHEPNIIGWRSAVYTYGIVTACEFEEGRHKPEYRFYVDGRAMCNNVFTKFVTRGDTVTVGQRTDPKLVRPTLRDQRSTRIALFATREADPVYVTDEACTEVGHFVLSSDLRLRDERVRHIEVRLILGGTETLVTARDGTTGEEFKSRCDFLSC